MYKASVPPKKTIPAPFQLGAGMVFSIYRFENYRFEKCLARKNASTAVAATAIQIRFIPLPPFRSILSKNRTKRQRESFQQVVECIVENSVENLFRRSF